MSVPCQAQGDGATRSGVVGGCDVAPHGLHEFLDQRQADAASRLKKKFDEKNIEIPFPHVTLYMGKGKDGKSPALNVSQVRNK